MAVMKTKIGHIPCLCCGEKIPVRVNERGALDVSCADCGFSAWAKAGTEAAEKIKAKMKPAGTTPPAPAPAPAQKKPAPAPEPAPTPKPAPARGSSVFHFS